MTRLRQAGPVLLWLGGLMAIGTTDPLPAIGFLVLGVLLLCVAHLWEVTAPPPRPLLEVDEPTPIAPSAPDRAYRGHTALKPLSCDSCGREVPLGRRYWIRWTYDDVLGVWSDADAPRLCEPCAHDRKLAEDVGVDGVEGLYARGEIDEERRDRMLDFLLAEDED